MNEPDPTPPLPFPAPGPTQPPAERLTVRQHFEAMVSRLTQGDAALIEKLKGSDIERVYFAAWMTAMMDSLDAAALPPDYAARAMCKRFEECEDYMTAMSDTAARLSAERDARLAETAKSN